MLNWVWGLMMLLSLGYGTLTGKLSGVLEALMSGGGTAIELVLKMAGGFCLWCGMIEILNRSGAVENISRIQMPLMKKLFPDIKLKETFSAITMNLAANMLGIGNAATPMGLKAMELMAEENARRERASRAMCMFLALNSCCIQLIPSTVLTLRKAAGSQDPGSIILPSFFASVVSSVISTCLCLWWGRRGENE